jgi:hypothetical protein
MIQIILLLNILIEGGVGLLFVVSPETVGLFAGADAKTLYMVRMYGFAAMTMAFLSVKVWEKMHEQEVLVLGLLIFTIFHFLIAAAQFLTTADPATTYPAGGMHLVLGAMFLFSYIREK